MSLRPDSAALANTASAPPEAASQEARDLSALVSARLCHDLVSPLGAIGNGLELIEMTGAGRSAAEIALISDSLENALGKLRFLRIAFGPAEPTVRQSFEEAAGITSSAFQGRFSVIWQSAGSDMPRPLAKAVYLAILCLEKSLPLGGEVRVSVGGSSAELRVDGRRTAPPAALWAHATDGAPLETLTSDLVQFTLLRACLVHGGGTLAARFGETDAAVAVSLPPQA